MGSSEGPIADCPVAAVFVGHGMTSLTESKGLGPPSQSVAQQGSRLKKIKNQTVLHN